MDLSSKPLFELTGENHTKRVHYCTECDEVFTKHGRSNHGLKHVREGVAVAVLNESDRTYRFYRKGT